MSISSVPSHTSSAFRRIFVTGPWLRKGLVAIAYSNGKPWHPLSYPMFTRSDALHLCDAIPGLSFDASRDAFIHVEQDQVACFEAESHIWNGKLVDLYAIGPGWGWQLAQDDRVPAAHSESLHVNVRPAALAWIQTLADDASVALGAFCSFLLSGYIEKRMELQHALDLTRFDAVLCIASKAPVGHDVAGIAVQVEEWIGIVDALVHLAADGAFNTLSRQTRRERIVEAMLDQLAREVGHV